MVFDNINFIDEFGKEQKLEFNNVYCVDCMKVLKLIPDKSIDLCIVDPPYGIGDKFKGGKTGKMNFNEVVDKGWDCVPTKEYFDELFRVSKNQIIWGGNYFDLPTTRCFIVWDKLISENFSLAMAELAWTSFDELAKIFRMATPKDGNKIHPTQKPVALYTWLLNNYAKQDYKILDTHLGSASSIIACEQSPLKLQYIGFEIDKEYFAKASKRIADHKAQMTIFEVM